MKKILNYLIGSALALTFGSTIVACEEEPIGLGGSIVGQDAEGNVTSLDVIAYNTHNDSLRADQRMLQNALLGAYEEPIFGRTKARLISQLRLSSTNPSFGTNSTVDSVHLFIPVYYNSSNDSVKADTINLSNPGKKAEDNDTIMIRKVYKVDSIYGNKNAKMRLNVRDISTVLYSDSTYYSNPNLRNRDNIGINPAVIGSLELGNTVENITIKQKVGSANIYEERIGYKISLDKNYFTEKILNNEKNGLLGDNAIFINKVIKGFEFSVEENNGFLFAFNPNQIELKMYYSFDNSDKEKDRLNSTFNFSFDNVWSSMGGNNVQINQIENTNKGSEFINNLSSIHQTEGSKRLYLNGSDGTLINVKFIADQINSLKTKKEAENWTIIGAKLQFHIDESYNFQKPPFLMAWNNYKQEGKVLDKLFADVLEYYNSYPLSVHFNPQIGDNKFYTIDITKHLKKMIEKNENFDEQIMKVAMGNFLMSNTDASTIFSSSPFYRNTIANPYRIVLHGNQSENTDKKLKLLVYYTKK